MDGAGWVWAKIRDGGGWVGIAETGCSNAAPLHEPIGFFLLKTGEPIVVAHLGTTPDAAHVEQIMNQTIHYGIWFAVAMAIVQVVKDLRHLLSSRAVRTEKAAAEA